jgi:hypothetical protein
VVLGGVEGKGGVMMVMNCLRLGGLLKREVGEM